MFLFFLSFILVLLFDLCCDSFFSFSSFSTSLPFSLLLVPLFLLCFLSPFFLYSFCFSFISYSFLPPSPSSSPSHTFLVLVCHDFSYLFFLFSLLYIIAPFMVSTSHFFSCLSFVCFSFPHYFFTKRRSVYRKKERKERD